MATSATTMTRRVWLSRLLMAAAVTPVIGLRFADPVAADKSKSSASVADRTTSQRQMCELGGGKLAVMDGPEGSGGNTTECKGGANDGWTCINTKTTSDCSKQQSAPPRLPTTTPGHLPDHSLEPLEPGGSPLTDPGQISDQPLEPMRGADIISADSTNTRLEASQHGKRKRHGRGKHRRR
jgi:hypothetical protein